MADKANKRAKFRMDNGSIGTFDPDSYNDIESMSGKEIDRMNRSREGSGDNTSVGPYAPKGDSEDASTRLRKALRESAGSAKGGLIKKKFSGGGLVARGMGVAKRGGQYGIC